MQLPDTSDLTKVNAIIHVIATIAYCVGFACPYWLVKAFVLEAVPPILYLDVNVDSNIGLFKACKVVASFLEVEEAGCTSEGAADWQKICGLLAIAALVPTVASCVLSVLTVVVAKLAQVRLLKLLTASLALIAAGLIIAVLIIFLKNKVFQVYPPLEQQEEFYLGWSYLVTLASASALVVLVITTILDFILANTCTRTGSS